MMVISIIIIPILFSCASTQQKRVESSEPQKALLRKVDADSIIGVWADKDQKYIYAFLENSKFKFWVFRDRPEKTQGVWKMDDKFWEESLRAKKVVMEELYIYADKVQCCMSPRFSENKLMLKKIWMRAWWVDALDVCSDKVLTKIEKMPQE